MKRRNDNLKRQKKFNGNVGRRRIDKPPEGNDTDGLERVM